MLLFRKSSFLVPLRDSYLVQCGLGDGVVRNAQLLAVVGQNVKDVGQRAGLWWQLVLQHVLVPLLQFNTREGGPDVGVHRAGLPCRLWQAQDDGVTISKSEWGGGIKDRGFQEHEFGGFRIQFWYRNVKTEQLFVLHLNGTIEVWARDLQYLSRHWHRPQGSDIFLKVEHIYT